MAMQTITARTANGPREMQAAVFGPLALHRCPGKLLDPVDDLWRGWNLTHVPSGLAINREPLPLRCAYALLRSLRRLDVDWGFSHPREMPDAKREAVLSHVAMAQMAAKLMDDGWDLQPDWVCVPIIPAASGPQKAEVLN